MVDGNGRPGLAADNRVCRICDGGPGNDCACTCGMEVWEQGPAVLIHDLVEALRPFVDIGSQKGAWGIISKKLGGMAPLTVTVTKAQMSAALAAISKATGAA